MVIIQSVKNNLFVLAFPVEEKHCPSPIRDGLFPKWDKSHGRWIFQDQRRRPVRPGDGAWLYDGKNAWYLSLAAHDACKDYRLVNEDGTIGDYLTRAALYSGIHHRTPASAADILGNVAHTSPRSHKRATILRDELGRFASRSASTSPAAAAH